MQKNQLDRATKRVMKTKGISKLKARLYIRKQMAKGKKLSSLGRSGG